MNETAARELKIIVERAVRPVRATLARKRRMREELLAHLAAVFEEETARLGDQRAALDRARERFGDPAELSRQLQDAVPWWDRVGSFCEKMQLQPGESLWHLAGKQLLAMLMAYGMAALAVLPVILARGRPYEVGVKLQVVLVTAVVCSGLWFLFSWVPLRIGRALYGDAAERSVSTALLYALASLPILPAAAFLTYWALTWNLSSSLAHLGLACYFAPAAPIVFVMAARQMTEEMRYQEQWAGLEIGE